MTIKEQLIKVLDDAAALLEAATELARRLQDEPYPPVDAWVNTPGSGLRLRADHSTSAAIRVVMPHRARVTALEGWSPTRPSMPPGDAIGVSGAWVRLTYNNASGWAAAQYLSPHPFEVSPGGSKLGPHIDRVLPGHLELCVGARVRFLLVDHNTAFATDYLKAQRDAVVINRNWLNEERTYSGDPVATADAWMGRMGGEFAAAEASGCDLTRLYWMGINEPPTGTQAERQWVAAFELARLRRLEQRGLRAALFAFGVGTPDYPHWPDYFPVLDAAHRGNHMLCLHEYFGRRALDMDRGYYGDLVRRYRWVWENVIRPHGWTNIRIGLGECGADYIAQIPGSGPWRWHSTPAEYMNELAQLDRWLLEDDYVLGGAVFLDGAGGDQPGKPPGSGWDHQIDNHPEMRQLFYDYIRSKNGG